VSVRIRPSAPDSPMPSCVVVAQGTLDPLAQVRILARQPFIIHFDVLFSFYNSGPFYRPANFILHFVVIGAEPAVFLIWRRQRRVIKAFQLPVFQFWLENHPHPALSRQGRGNRFILRGAAPLLNSPTAWLDSCPPHLQ
jgi:hypothetical protein